MPGGGGILVIRRRSVSDGGPQEKDRAENTTQIGKLRYILYLVRQSFASWRKR